MPEAAAELHVSPARVRQMIAAGQLDAERIAGRWIVDAGSLRRSPQRAGRPMSPRVAWALLLDPSPEDQWLGPDEAYRLRSRARRLRSANDSLALLRAWMANRAEVHHMQVQDAVALVADERVVPSGVSDPRSGTSAAGHAEGYVHADDLADVEADHLLVPAPRARANAVLRVSPILPPDPVPDLLLVADLADADSPREEARAWDLLRRWLASQASADPDS
ncbi:DNA-binding protein [Oerskovia turbata]|uniref:DNA-binding protein n=1 Tax=Oerskovia turbata TaxID=1713 RepID=A0A4V1N4F6_9CELL|nr:helix-turn-helix domain-containing protein [Oerskovia turbata]RXR22045.1 DNA-binding protein [Oerskovia turbata]RXR31996.1 DNA-binding protein [Oerskovia turbata]